VPGNVRISGWDFVAAAFQARNWGLPTRSKAAREAVDKALNAVGAHGLASRPVGELSGGERQRLFIAQALIDRPKLILLDEPLMNLDPRHQDETLKLIARIHRETGATVLLSAHEINPLAGIVDKVLYLGGGKAAIGTVEDVVTGPVLSRLYGTSIDVVHLRGRIFVMSGGHDVEHEPHGHHHHDA
jgi:zinc/manganese transport system ATP-binding protein